MECYWHTYILSRLRKTSADTLTSNECGIVIFYLFTIIFGFFRCCRCCQSQQTVTVDTRSIYGTFRIAGTRHHAETFRKHSWILQTISTATRFLAESAISDPCLCGQPDLLPLPRLHTISSGRFLRRISLQLSITGSSAHLSPSPPSLPLRRADAPPSDPARLSSRAEPSRAPPPRHRRAAPHTAHIAAFSPHSRTFSSRRTRSYVTWPTVWRQYQHGDTGTAGRDQRRPTWPLAGGVLSGKVSGGVW